MNTEAAAMRTSPVRRANAGIEWYVHKHRREHEAALWDESRLQPAIAQAGSSATRVLVRFASCVIGMTAILGLIVTVIR